MCILLIHKLQLYNKCLYQKCLSPHMLQILHKEEGRFIEKQRGSDLWRPSIHTFHPTPPTLIIYNLIKDAFYNTGPLIKLNVRSKAELLKLPRTCTLYMIPTCVPAQTLNTCLIQNGNEGLGVLSTCRCTRTPDTHPVCIQGSVVNIPLRTLYLYLYLYLYSK